MFDIDSNSLDIGNNSLDIGNNSLDIDNSLQDIDSSPLGCECCCYNRSSCLDMRLSS